MIENARHRREDIRIAVPIPLSRRRNAASGANRAGIGAEKNRRRIAVVLRMKKGADRAIK
jgi:hypothetical protein